MAIVPVSPVTPQVPPAQERVVSTLAVDLAAAIDPITPWVDTITTSLFNLKSLNGLYWQQPFPLLTTIARNQFTYLQELPNIGLIASQMWNNVKTFFTAPYVSTPDNVSDAMVTNIEGLPISQQTVYALLQTMVGGGQSPLTPLVDFTGIRLGAEFEPLLQFTATPVSGEILGLLGPVISPLIQLTESFTAVGRYWRNGEVLAALNELINIPANVTNAVLNGGKYLDLTGVVKTLGFTLPPQIKSVGFNMGGLLNVVPTAYEPPTLPGSNIHPYSGGLAFDALATEIDSALPFNDPGWPVGAIGSVMGLGQALGDALLVTRPDPTATKAAAAVAAPEAVEAAAPVIEPAAPGETAAAIESDTAPRAHRTAASPAGSSDDTAGRASSRGVSRGHRAG